jgi:hypothetical protein
VALVLLPALGAGIDARADVVYALGNTAYYLEGCFDPCDCLEGKPQGIGGTFVLEFAGSKGTLDTYDVLNVDWVGGINGEIVPITGSGTYEIETGDEPQQRLQLDLVIGDQPVQHFDSGWVPGADFPLIIIDVSMNGMVCYDKLFHIIAFEIPDDTYDLDADGHVGAGDLAMLLAVWGSCQPPGSVGCDEADFNDDGAVGAADLAELLANWTG